LLRRNEDGAASAPPFDSSIGRGMAGGAMSREEVYDFAVEKNLHAV
jgi:hypothetical protein